MKITIVMGFFLPMPPAAGGATEKSWHGLAREFALLGDEVTIISRHWQDWPNQELQDRVQYLRLRGYSHTAHLSQNLWRDFKWSWRVWQTLPPADITIVNAIFLPVWLGWLRRHAGALVLMPGRTPQGQFRLYRRADCVLAVSTTVKAALLQENPRLASRTFVSGYPIDCGRLVGPRPHLPATPITLGYVGRIHREKGLDLFAAAIEVLASNTRLPPWRLVVCGPADVARGGSGEEYAARLAARFSAAAPWPQFERIPAVFDEETLAAVYRSIDIFCYPSLAARGETFGVAVAEAMAAGAVPVVSDLPCFRDFVRAGENGEVFDHTSSDAAIRLAALLSQLIADQHRRSFLASNAQADAQQYDFPVFASRLSEIFSKLK